MFDRDGSIRKPVRELTREKAMSTIDQRYDEAIALQRQGDTEAAIAALGQIVADSPGFALAHAALSAFYSRLGRHEEAIEHGRQVCQLEADDPFSFMAMSLVCQRAGRNAEAEEAMARAMELQWAARRGG